MVIQIDKGGLFASIFAGENSRKCDYGGRQNNLQRSPTRGRSLDALLSPTFAIFHSQQRSHLKKCDVSLNINNLKGHNWLE
jgi:hypothetical protein